MHRAEPGFVLHIHWPDQGLWYSQQRGPLVFTGMVQLPTEFIQLIKLFNVGMTGPLKRWLDGYFWDIGWAEARLYTGTSHLFNLFLTYVFNYNVHGLDEGVYIHYHFYVAPWVSNGRTKSPITKSWTEQNQPQLKWYCWKPSSAGLAYYIWMVDEHIPKQLFFGELAQGQRKQGQPQKCYKDTLKSSLKWCGIKPS